MELTGARTLWPEKAGFSITRPKGLEEYTFLHFVNSVQLQVGEELFTTKPNACIFYGPDQPQYFRSPETLVHNWMHVDREMAQYLQKYHIAESVIYYPSDPTFITDSIRILERECYGKEEYAADSIQANLISFLIGFSRMIHNPEHPRPDAGEQEALLLVRQQILLELDRNWTVKEMADLACISESRFYYKYKKLFRISPNNDLIYARITAAQNQLLGSDKSVGEVAAGLGYSNVYHFIRQFDKVTGMTPGAYRKKYLEP